MKVAVLGPSHPYRGGIAHYTTSLYRALMQAHHEVQLYNFTRQYPSVLFPGTTQTDRSREPFVVPNRRCIDTLNPLTWAATGERVARFGAQLMVVQWWHPYFAPTYGTIARVVRYRSSARVVFLCHNVTPHEPSIFDRRLIRFAFGPAHAFMVQAAREREQLRELVGYQAPIEVAPHPVYDVFSEVGASLTKEEARRHLGLRTERVLLFFGYIRPYKGLSVLLRAMPLLKTPDTTLVIAGECYEDKQHYLDQIESLGLQGRVRFIDRYIPNEEVPQYFSAADLVVVPYLTATQSGIVQVAYNFEVPVIVSRVGGIPEIVEDGRTGLLVDPNRERQLAAAVDRFFENGLAERLKAGIRSKREAFGWERVVEALLRLSAA